MKRRPSRSGDRASRIREELLREWRGAPEPEDLNAGIHLASRFLDAILKQAGAADGIDEEEIRSIWKELAGDFIASHTEPVSVKSGHLVLRVTQPAMRFHLEQMKPLLLRRIQERFGAAKIKSVKFTLG
ncbi:MAG: DUF721 domain-containing protein [Luteolibacter sp.]